MAAYNNFILTNQGMGLLADLMNGNGEMEFRCLAVGSGSYATKKNIEEIRGMENLKEERQRVMFSSIWKAENGFVNLKANLTNKDLDAGYPMTEAGIYVGKKGEQEEILYCLSTVDKPDYMPDYSSKQIYNVIFKMMISIGDVSNPTISYTTDMYALAEDLQEEVRRAAEAENKLDLRKLDKNGDASDTMINFIPAESLEQLQSGKEQKVLYGQMAKAVAALIAHLADKLNPHDTTKEQVGLGNADNTSDMDKPVSVAQQAALDALYEQLTAYVLQKIADLIGGAPTTLDTLKEIADAIAAHKSVTDALDAAIGRKANAAEFDSHVKDKSNPHLVTKAQIGLGNVDNTADSQKSVNYANSAGNANTVNGMHISVVSSLPSDAASHADTLYIVI